MRRYPVSANPAPSSSDLAPLRRCRVIGLTGSFGTGKTTVARMFARLGARVIDADKIAHAVIKRGKPSYRKIVARFGDRILKTGREIDRKKLGRAVFKDKNTIAALNRIIHPEVIASIKCRIRKAGKRDVVVIDAPLLVEAGLVGILDKLVVVNVSKKVQIDRCRKKFRIKKEDVLKRIGCQIPIGEKIKLADFVVDNNGTKSETGIHVRRVWEEIWK